MNKRDITRRELLAAGGGLTLTSSWFTSLLLAQVANRKDIIFRTTMPRNGEPELGKLVQSWQTPTSLFYSGSRPEDVFVSGDMGKHWVKAELSGRNADFCWQLWKTEVTITNETKYLIVKATDSSGGFMPGRVPWNAKGYLQNSWFKLPIKVG